MRFDASVASLSWIPSEAVTELATRLPFEWGIAHYDQPPPDVITDLEELRRADRFRFANELHAWIEVDDGRIVGYGQSGGGLIGSTTIRLGGRQAVLRATELPEIRPEPQVSDSEVVFTQTCGGRTGVPAPRWVRHPPYFQISSPLAWTTLSLTIRTDGSSNGSLAGASPFPRHWVYGDGGRLETKSGMIDFTNWYHKAFGRHSPWGDRDSAALTMAVETALERRLSIDLMHGKSAPDVRTVAAGEVITEQGSREDDLVLVLDGVVGVEHDGTPLAELGPGALLGERAALEGGVRTSTLRAVTRCKLALAPSDRIDKELLFELSQGHRREDSTG